MAKDSLKLAKHIIFLLKQLGDNNISNTKIQKILYCYVGFGLAKKINKDDIINELPNAFDNGPVFPKVFNMIKKANNIEELGEDYANDLNDAEKGIMDKTVKALWKFKAGQLSTWTHLSKSPWDIVYNEMEAKYAKIPLELIKEYFEEEVEDLDVGFIP